MIRNVGRALAVAVSSLALLVGCAGRDNEQRVTTSGKLYSSAEEVARDADVIASGVLGERQQTLLDDGGAPDGPKFSVTLYEFKLLQANPSSVRSIRVVLANDMGTDSLVAKVRPGASVVMMMTRLNPSPKSSLSSWGEVYVPFEEGAFSVDSEGKATAIFPLVGALKVNQPASRLDGKLVTTTADLLSLSPKS